MGSYQAVFVRLDGPSPDDLEALVRDAVGARGLQQCVLRQAAHGAWVQLQPAVVGTPIGPANPFTGEPLLDAWPSLSAFAGDLSTRWAGEVVTLELQTAADWIRFSRWRAGRCIRLFEYCSQLEEPFTRNEGESEPWEQTSDGEQISDGPAVGRALGLPGFDATPWAREISLGRHDAAV